MSAKKPYIVKKEKKPIKKFDKKCYFCENKVAYIDFKDTSFLKRYTSGSAKILPRRFSGNCQKHQDHTAQAIKRAREMALLPFIKVK